MKKTKHTKTQRGDTGIIDTDCMNQHCTAANLLGFQDLKTLMSTITNGSRCAQIKGGNYSCKSEQVTFPGLEENLSAFAPTFFWEMGGGVTLGHTPQSSTDYFTFKIK